MLRRFAKNWSWVVLAIAGGLVVLFNWSGLGWRAFSIPTGSMRPDMPPGSLAIVHKVPARSLRAGDIITYVNPLNPKETITHRIVKTYMISGKVPGFITKGDANRFDDPPVVEGQVVGKVVRHVPHLGSWMMWERGPVGLFIIIYIPALILMAAEVKRMSDYLRSRLPYRVPDFKPAEEPAHHHKAVVVSVATTFVILGLFIWQPALALLKSNTVTLANNHLTVAAHPVQCSSHNNISVSNSSNQTASSGNATSSNNTSSGSVTSGSASNSSSSNTSITVTGC